MIGNLIGEKVFYVVLIMVFIALFGWNFYKHSMLKDSKEHWAIITRHRPITARSPAAGVFEYTIDLSDARLSNPVMTTTGGVLQQQAIRVDLNGLTQYGANFGVTNLSQNGYTTGQLSGIDVDQSGVISARFTNGQSNNLGQVYLTSFTNVQGLSQLGDNYWGESFSSGQGIVNAPGEGNAGLINSGALEDSNVDLTEQLINLITAQRNFQANAKTITTADTITQTVIQL